MDHRRLGPSIRVETFSSILDKVPRVYSFSYSHEWTPPRVGVRACAREKERERERGGIDFCEINGHP